MRQMPPRDHPELVFWRDVPVDVERDVLQYVAQNWGARCTIICEHDYPSDRALLPWREDGLDQVILERTPELQITVDQLLDRPNTIHIFNGFRGDTRRHLRRRWKSVDFTWGVVAERPTEFRGSIIGRAKNLASHLVYRRLSRRYGPHLRVFFAMGIKGREAYKRLGFPSDVLFPFMYGPFEPTLPKREPPSDTEQAIRLIYVGRLDSANKGLDLLLETVQGMDRSDFTLDIVGGYGDLAGAVEAAAAGGERIRFLGTWEPDNVVRNMSAYDVCVIPSRYDGWNVVTNHAINAGLACVVSDGATSDELVTVSGAGIVVPRNNQRALGTAIGQMLDSREGVDTYKERAAAYRSLISPESVGQYMIDVLYYTFGVGDGSHPPSCPWLADEVVNR